MTSASLGAPATRRDVSRAQLVALLAPAVGGARVRLRRVQFTDLARAEAYTLRLEGPSTPQAEAALVDARRQYTYRGARLI